MKLSTLKIALKKLDIVFVTTNSSKVNYKLTFNVNGISIEAPYNDGRFDVKTFIIPNQQDNNNEWIDREFWKTLSVVIDRALHLSK